MAFAPCSPKELIGLFFGSDTSRRPKSPDHRAPTDRGVRPFRAIGGLGRVHYPIVASRLARATCPYQVALGLAWRSNVFRSTACSPNLGPYPMFHSKLSSRLQTKKPRTSTPSLMQLWTPRNTASMYST